MALPLQGLESENPCPLGEKAFVIPHVLERAGTTSTTNFTFDTTIYTTYVGGLAGIPDGGGASLDLYLFGDDGALMKNNGVSVCGTCLFNLSASQRKESIRVDDLILLFSYELARASDVELSVYDASGRRVATVATGPRDAGVHQARWDGRDDAGARALPGVYFDKLTGVDGSLVTKLVVLP